MPQGVDSMLINPNIHLEVHVNDFIGLTNSIRFDYLQHILYSLLHVIYVIFPSPKVMGDNGHNLIAKTKLEKGDST